MPPLEAQTPILLLGGGAMAVSTEDLRALAELLDAPVLNTVNGKGLLDPGHALAVGASARVTTPSATTAATTSQLARFFTRTPSRHHAQ